jgi:hypothetical protein
MAVIKKEDLKKKFLNGTKPTQVDFADMIDHCYGYVESGRLEGDQLILAGNAGGAVIAPTVQVNLAALSQSLAYNALTNELTISGRTESRRIGYWGPNPNSRNDVAAISTNAKVGIKKENPVADLDINGSLALKYGVSAREILSSFGSNSDLTQAIPTAQAVIDYFQSTIAGLRREIEVLRRSAAQKMLEVGIKPRAAIAQGTGEVVFDRTWFVHDKQKWQDGIFFAIPEAGLYRISINLKIQLATSPQGVKIQLIGIQSPTLYYLDPAKFENNRDIAYQAELEFAVDQLIYLTISGTSPNDKITFNTSDARNNVLKIDKLYGHSDL